jgi:hypothetical protein
MAPVTVDVSAYADGNSHTVRIEGTDSDGLYHTNWFVDDVYLTVVSEPTIDTLALFNTSNNAVAVIDTLAEPPTYPDNYNIFTTGTGILGSWVMGDWDGDGTETPGVYDTGTFWYTNTLGNTDQWTGMWIGPPAGKPVAGDFDNGGHDCFALVVEDIGVWWTCDIGNASPTINGQWLGGQMTDRTGDYQFTAGDFNNDGYDTLVIRRGEYITWTNVHTSTDMAEFTTAQYFGQPSASDYGIVLSGDWDGDGVTSFGMFYNDAAGTFFYRDDLDWNSGLYDVQHVGQPIGTANIWATSWH